MDREIFYGISLGVSFLGFVLLYLRMGKVRFLSGLLRRTQEGMEASARQRLLADRIRLGQLENRHSSFLFLQRQLYYSGLHIQFPKLTVEKWIVWNLLGIALLFMGSCSLCGWVAAIVAVVLFVSCEWMWILVQKAKMMHLVNLNILKFLDFMGNYSITSGEVTSVLNQVSHYVDEPLKTVLNECYAEAQMTGDTGMALLAMAEKVEHPKFKELVRNMEISIRYCADFKVLVAGSRRSVREYLRMREERKGMLREASINMGLLLVMSIFVMLAVDGLIDGSIWHVLLYSVPGHIALGIVAGIFALFLSKVYRM